MTTRDPLITLVVGLAVGALGSYSDDLVGASVVVSILQVALWISAGVLLGAFVSSRGRRHTRPGGLRPSPS